MISLLNSTKSYRKSYQSFSSGLEEHFADCPLLLSLLFFLASGVGDDDDFGLDEEEDEDDALATALAALNVQ